MTGLETLQHRVDCERPDVHVTAGVTRDLHVCRTCGAEAFVPKPLPS